MRHLEVRDMERWMENLPTEVTWKMEPGCVQRKLALQEIKKWELRMMQEATMTWKRFPRKPQRTTII